MMPLALAWAGISIHAPAWGATVRKATLNCVDIISIHAPAWGATVWKTLLDEFVEISIHAPAWGATSSASWTLTIT